jgi:GMP synthase (glutamine-hydrolysing)
LLYVTIRFIAYILNEADQKDSTDGMQELAYRASPDNVIAGTHREYGHAILKPQTINSHVDRLFQGLEEPMRVWMSHGDKLTKLPEGFHTVATSDNSEYAAIAHGTKPIYGLQFHPEVTHTPNGTKLLENFALTICGSKQTWTMSAFMSQEIERIRELVGKNGQVLGAVSGGVDSTVAAKLMVCISDISDILYSSLGSLAHVLLNFYRHFLQGKKS